MNDEKRRLELADFLRTRRESLSPSQFQLPEGTKRRRTPGLRREEMAQVAGMSLTWYTKLEQGQEIQVSTQVLEGLSQALRLTVSERAHLYVLAREELPLPFHYHTQKISADLQATLDALNPLPAFIANERWDIIGWNQIASLVFTDYAALSDWERNVVWIMFTHSEQRVLYEEWECWARYTMALFRASSAHNTNASWFLERRDRLMQASPEFRAWWQRHEVEEAYIGHKELNHPLVGTLALQSTTFLVGSDPHLKMLLYTPLVQADTAQKLAWLLSPRVVSGS